MCLLLVALTLDGCSNSSEPAAEEPTATVAAQTAVPGDQQELDHNAPHGLKLLAHRGVHQTFSPEGVDDLTCTATQIVTPPHAFLENTIPSMAAAFSAGASVVEIDIARTSDGVLAVFHDWEVDCRTNGSGEIRSLTWDQLASLDIGYGYTSDGETYPLRGQGQGLMPRLEEVFAAFPDGQFLINFKSNDPIEATLLQQVVEEQNAAGQVWAVYGAPVAVDAYVAATGTRGFADNTVLACLNDYLTGEDPDARLPSCEETIVVVPLNFAPALPGWPEAFVERMAQHGTDVIIVGPGQTGIDTKADLDNLPPEIDAYVWTNRIEVISR